MTGFDYAEAMQSISEIGDAMSFLIKNDFIAWVLHNVSVDQNVVIVNDDDTDKEGKVAMLSTLPSDDQNCKTFNGMMEEMNNFIMMNSPWF